MNYRDIEHAENEFLETGGNGHYNLEPIEVHMPTPEMGILHMIKCTPKHKKSYYYKRLTEKTQIVLHFTLGNVKGDTHVLTGGQGRVSVPYLILRNGTILNLFDDKYWSYHIGRNGVLGSNELASKRSIGVELSNYGILHKKDDELHTDYSDRYNHDVYCSISDKKEYVKLNTPFRGYRYFCTYTDAQYKSLILLLKYLTYKHNIPRTFLDASQRFKTGKFNAIHKGIVSHVNHRIDKVDLPPYPAFDWLRVEQGINETLVNVIGADVEDKLHAQTVQGNGNTIPFAYGKVQKLNEGDVLNVRSGNGIQYAILKTLKNDDWVELLEVKGDWYRVDKLGWSDGVYWLHGDYINELKGSV